MKYTHSFHIPVMGVAYTIDAAIRLSPMGINSVIPLGDDNILERMRKMYAEKFNLPYTPISEKNIDYRAQRITSYLNMILDLSEKKYEELLNTVNHIKEYIDLLPYSKDLMNEFKQMLAKKFSSSEIKKRLKEKLGMGDIDVNIMTKIDKDNYKNGEKLPVEYNDAHASFRGFAKSNLRSSVIFSAGMNPR
jgi:hypothetical protein